MVSDNGSDRSLFVRELLKEIRVPDLMAEETLNKTRVGVTRASRGEQVPWISSSLAEDFSFIPGSGKPPGQVAALPPLRKPPIPQITPAAVSNRRASRPRHCRRSNRRRCQSPPPCRGRDAAAAAVEPPPLPRVETPPRLPKSPMLPDKPAGKPDGGVALADDPTIKSLTDKLDANPDDANALYRRGQVYASKGAYALAIKDFDNSLRLNPKDVEAYNNRCWARTVIGDLQAALKDCNEALRLRPNFVDALDSRGLVNLKSGQTKNAIADFDAALKINPRLTSSLYGRGLAKQRNGSISEGELDISNAKAMDPNIVKEFAELRGTLTNYLSEGRRGLEPRGGRARLIPRKQPGREVPARPMLCRQLI